MRKLTSLGCWMLLPIWLSAQTYLINPSFEGDEPQDATVPAGWHACKEGTTPDILPGVWGVYQEASEGETYVGLITRSDGTWESIGQRLSTPLKAKECYSFSLDLCRAITYAGYNNPIKLRIWGGSEKCVKTQLLAESKFISHTDWETYTYQFVPKGTLHYIILEAFYTEGNTFSHQGNIMIDHIRPIKVCIRAGL
ncbi:MAG: carbohydrate binding domain-containing protein [Saprospirales bacterium]|nr:carbohydrate binding domain-containing protein [Saprospirales bacterium]